ncbi:MAG: SAM-dependent methyltransferase [Bifidobacteriaceae bacterium]|nr:SAM-dependent methyltransferase [Bifidobacteriaceae bacterium]
MRATLVLDDAIYKQAKHLAVNEGRTLTSVFDEALRTYLKQRLQDPGFSIRDVAAGSGGMLIEPDRVKEMLDLEEADRQTRAMAAGGPSDRRRA